MAADALLGYSGTAEPVAPLSGEETVGSVKAGVATPPSQQINDHIGETAKTPLHDHEHEMVTELGESQEGLSLLLKLGLVGLILALCYGWVRAHSPSSSAPAGRHGAYAKSGQV